jgi:hypothetical protein
VSVQSWEEVISIMVADGPTLTAASEALLVPDVVIPANYMYPGRMLRGHLWGKASAVITTPGTLQFRVRWGGLAGTLLLDSGAMNQRAASASTNESWSCWFEIVCRSAGSSGTFMSYGEAIRRNKEDAAAVNALPDTLPVSGNAVVAVDTTTAKNLSFTATPSLTTASITCQGYTLEATN